jgi:hypothetical protein
LLDSLLGRCEHMFDRCVLRQPRRGQGGKSLDLHIIA